MRDNMDGPKHWNIELEQIGPYYLTLAAWQPDSQFPPTYEIGVRIGKDFTLIQFSMPSLKAWNIAKKVIAKGGSLNTLQRIMERLDN